MISTVYKAKPLKSGLAKKLILTKTYEVKKFAANRIASRIAENAG